MMQTYVSGASCAKDFLGDVTFLHNFFPLFLQLIKALSLMCKLFAWWPIGTS